MKVLYDGDHEHWFGNVSSHRHNAIVECECGKLARAYHPGNPDYSRWRGLGVLGRIRLLGAKT